MLYVPGNYGVCIRGVRRGVGGVLYDRGGHGKCGRGTRVSTGRRNGRGTGIWDWWSEGWRSEGGRAPRGEYPRGSTLGEYPRGSTLGEVSWVPGIWLEAPYRLPRDREACGSCRGGRGPDLGESHNTRGRPRIVGMPILQRLSFRRGRCSLARGASRPQYAITRGGRRSGRPWSEVC